MSLQKQLIVDGETVISAELLNNIQDAIIDNESKIESNKNKLNGAFPTNLLINSNFRNPVNQNGQTSYANAGYHINKWYKESNSVVSIEDGYITIDNTASSKSEVLFQNIDADAAAKLVGKTITLAICLADGTVYANSGVVDYDVGVGIINESSFALLLQFFTASGSYQAARLIVYAGQSVSVKWIALYEGDYTVETLPPYVPKGYAEELLACQVADTGELTANNSENLGGKPPEAYSAVNLLDNSDFRNPVNQREFVSGNKIAAYTYFLDRWYHGSSDSRAISLSSYGLGLISDTTITQKVSGINAGKTVTFAVCLSDERIFLCSATITYNQDKSWIRLATSWDNLLDLYIDTQNDTVNFVVYSKTNITIQWAALYEGTYTAETLPPYVPKGYAAELMECRRYYYRLPFSWAGLTNLTRRSSTSFRGAVILPVPMVAEGQECNITNLNKAEGTVLVCKTGNLIISEITFAAKHELIFLTVKLATATEESSGFLYGGANNCYFEVIANALGG